MMWSVKSKSDDKKTREPKRGACSGLYLCEHLARKEESLGIVWHYDIHTRWQAEDSDKAVTLIVASWEHFANEVVELERYPDRQSATAGHARWVERVRRETEPDALWHTRWSYADGTPSKEAVRQRNVCAWIDAVKGGKRA